MYRMNTEAFKRWTRRRWYLLSRLKHGWAPFELVLILLLAFAPEKFQILRQEGDCLNYLFLQNAVFFDQERSFGGKCARFGTYGSKREVCLLLSQRREQLIRQSLHTEDLFTNWKNWQQLENSAPSDEGPLAWRWPVKSLQNSTQYQSEKF